MFKRNSIETELDNEIKKLQETMRNVSAIEESRAYAAMVDQLVKLHELRHKSRVSKDALITIAANLGGIIAILNHERAHVIASKAFGLVKKVV